MPTVQLNIPYKPFLLLPLMSYPYEPPIYFPSSLVSQDANRIILSRKCKISSLTQQVINRTYFFCRQYSFLIVKNIIIKKKHNWDHSPSSYLT